MGFNSEFKDLRGRLTSVGIVTTLRAARSAVRFRGTAVAQWLRCCATIRKVAGSIVAGVTGIFH